MARSMTGYGRGEFSAQDRKFNVEIKSVNHRYNDINIKLPRSMNNLEDRIRKVLLKSIFRGKTDVYINFETFSTDDIIVKLDEILASAYVEKLNILKDTHNLTSDDTLGLVAKFPDVISVEKAQEDENVIWQILENALNMAIDNFVSMKKTEGQALKNDILAKADKITSIIEEIKERSPLVVKEYQQKMELRLSELLGDVKIDEQRIATEVAIMADKCCVDEELTRLESHICQLKNILDNEELVGRKLDFLVQEMNREANTTGSKANDMVVTRLSIELKSEIEKIREQIQNLE